MGQELAQYLETAMREGQLHSQGAFTVDFLRSKELLGSALFSHPANYLLKVVQSAVSAQPRDVRVQMKRDKVQISFCPDFVPPSLDAVEKAVQDPLQLRSGAAGDEKSSRFLRHLGLALQSALAQDPQLLIWGYRDPNGGEALVVRAQAGMDRQFYRIPLPHEGVAQGECIFQVILKPQAQSLLNRMFGSSQSSAAASGLLTSSCQFSTTPIFLDGRLINLPQIPRQSKDAPLLSWGYHYDVLVERVVLSKLPYYDLLLVPPPSERPAAVYDLGSGTKDLFISYNTVLYQWRSFNEPNSLFPMQPKPGFKPVADKLLDRLMQQRPRSITLGHPAKWDSRTEARPFYHVPDIGDWTRPAFGISYRLLSTVQPLAAHAYLVAPTQPADSSSRLVVVQDGVALHPARIDLPIEGMTVIVADNRLKTDLSGLQLVEGERYQQLVDWLRREAESMHKEGKSVVRFAEKLSMHAAQVKDLRQRLGIGEEY